MPAHNGLDRLRLIVGWLVVVVWTASVIGSAFLKGYNPPATIHLAMMLVVGALFGPTIAGRRR